MSHRRLGQVTAASLLIAAVLAVVAIPGIGRWVLAAILGGLGSALGGIVTRGTDKALAHGIATALPTAVPIRIHATQSVGTTHGYIERPPSSGAPTGGTERVNIGMAAVHIFVEASADRAVILIDITIRVESRAPAPQTVRIDPPASPGPMARDAVRCFDIDLEDPVPTLRPDSNTPGFPYTVAPLDPERFILRAHVHREEIAWRFEVNWLFNGQPGTTLVDNHGEPFRLVGLAAPKTSPPCPPRSNT